MSHTLEEAKSLVKLYSDKIIGMDVKDVNGSHLATAKHLVIVPSEQGEELTLMRITTKRYAENGNDNDEALNFTTEKYSKIKDGYEVYVLSKNGGIVLQSKLEDFIKKHLTK